MGGKGEGVICLKLASLEFITPSYGGLGVGKRGGRSFRYPFNTRKLENITDFLLFQRNHSGLISFNVHQKTPN